jgi:CheY-like chemotaxis protein
MVNVLFVEDNSVAATLGKMKLKSLGCEVDVKESGEEAIEQIKKKQYDLIFLDLGLTGIDGVETCFQMRRYEKENGITMVPIIAMSADASAKQQEICKAAGMNYVIIKPFTLTEAQEVLSFYMREFASSPSLLESAPA